MAELLVVTADEDSADTIRRLARGEGYSVTGEAALAPAQSRLRRSSPDLVVCDLELPDGDGSELLREIEARPAVEVVMLTGNATVESAVEALRRGAFDYLVKPVDEGRLRMLLRRVRDAVALRGEVVSLRRELRELGRFGALVGASDAMQMVYDLIERVAPTEVTVLLTGQSGTGKELVAETIHRLSRRSDGPFVPVNCGAIASQLIESELFGHERGSFTGAERRHAGVFERASGGTLLLDEITEMSANLQVQLLRVLETSTIRRVGGSEAIPIDVRVVAATNRDPETAVAENRLREDLLYRLNVFPIHLPPLAERAGDVERLAMAFLERLCRASGRSVRITSRAMEVLGGHSWPGNVRELRNALERAFVLADDSITPDLLPAEVNGTAPGRQELDLPTGMPLDELVRRHTLATLDQLGGNKRRTARTLGISVKTLYNRLKTYRVGDGSP